MIERTCNDPAPHHRWSGWPGAVCLVCGAEDALEQCVADGHPDDCKTCHNESCSGSPTAPAPEVHP
mgnify:CR=1 FL=1